MNNAVEKLNPYSLKQTTEAIPTKSPVMLIDDSELEIVDFTMDDFIGYMPEFENTLKNKALVKTFETYLKQARIMFPTEIFSDDTSRMISLYIAHILYNKIRAIKNIDNELTLSTQNNSQTTENAKGGKESKPSNMSYRHVNENWDYYSTSPYGVELYNAIKLYSKIYMIGVR